MQSKDKARVLGFLRRRAKSTRKQDPIGYLFNPKRFGPMTEVLSGIGRRHFASKANPGPTTWRDKVPGHHIVRGGGSGTDSFMERLKTLPAIIKARRRRK